MKNKIFILTIFLLLFLYGCLEKKSVPPLMLKIDSKQDSYGKKDVVSLIVDNVSKEEIVYGVGMDLKIENKWVEYLYNSETPWKGRYIYFQLEPGEKRIHYWPNVKTDAIKKPYNKNLKLRFRVSYGLNKNNSMDEIYSAPKIYSEEIEYRIQ